MKGLQSLRLLRPVLRLYFAEKRNGLLAGMLLAASTVLAGIALLGLSGWFITATAIAGLSATTALVFDVFAPAAGIRFLSIVRTGSRYLERLVTHDATLSVLAALREKLFRSWAMPQAAQALLQRPAKLLFRLTADIDALDSLYLRVLVPAGAAFATALITGIALGLMHPLFGLLLGMALLVVGLGIPLVAARGAEKSMRRRAKATEALRARSIDLVMGQTELVMAGRLDAQISSLRYADQKIGKADDAINRLDMLTGAGFGIANGAFLAVSLVVVTSLVQANLIGAPVAVLGVLITLAAMEPFSALRRGAMELGRTILAARRLSPQLVGDKLERRAIVQPDAGLAVMLTNVAARHAGARQAVLHDIDLSIAAGEKIAIIGASGAGKSTLLALIADELRPHSGVVKTLPATLLTQRIELFQDSLAENLRLANPQADDATLLAALNDAGLGETVASMPLGLATRLGEGGLGLSTGQSRRLALARLFLRDTPVWLLDEPTEGLDSATADDVLERLQRRAGSRTLLIVTHVQREAMIADRAIVLNQGTIAENVYKHDQRFTEIFNGLRRDGRLIGISTN